MTNKELEQLVKSLEGNLIEMAKAIKDLSTDITEIKSKPTNPEPVVSTTAEPFKMSVPVGANNYPVPQEYKDIVNSVLNKYFGIEIVYTAAGFIFTVIVPEKYSTLTDKEKEIIKQDRRSKLIPNFEGVNGVKMWVDLIYSSFSMEYKALITQDK
jgi:hypothetical protein